MSLILNSLGVIVRLPTGCVAKSPKLKTETEAG